MKDILKILLEFLIVYIGVFILYWLIFVRKKTKYNPNKVPVEFYYLVSLYRLDQSKINYNTEIYKEYKSKCRELEEKYPRVLKVYEDSTPIVLNQEEMIKLMEIKELDIKVGYEEAKACFKAGINEILNF